MFAFRSRGKKIKKKKKNRCGKFIKPFYFLFVIFLKKK